jgi:hypothetical protein
MQTCLGPLGFPITQRRCHICGARERPALDTPGILRFSAAIDLHAALGADQREHTIVRCSPSPRLERLAVASPVVVRGGKTEEHVTVHALWRPSRGPARRGTPDRPSFTRLATMSLARMSNRRCTDLLTLDMSSTDWPTPRRPVPRCPTQ